MMLLEVASCSGVSQLLPIVHHPQQVILRVIDHTLLDEVRLSARVPCQDRLHLHFAHQMAIVVDLARLWGHGGVLDAIALRDEAAGTHVVGKAQRNVVVTTFATGLLSRHDVGVDKRLVHQTDRVVAIGRSPSSLSDIAAHSSVRSLVPAEGDLGHVVDCIVHTMQVHVGAIGPVDELVIVVGTAFEVCRLLAPWRREDDLKQARRQSRLEANEGQLQSTDGSSVLGCHT